MKHLSVLTLLFMSFVLLSCSKDEDNNSSPSESGPTDEVIVSGIYATVNGEQVGGIHPCPGEDNLTNCNIRIESTGLVRMKVTTSEVDQTGYNIEFFIDDLEDATFPLEIEQMDGSDDDIPLTFRYYDGSWSGGNEYRYQNFPGSDGNLSFTILNYDGTNISGKFSGEVHKLSSAGEIAVIEDGVFDLELHPQ
ncbi:hypothetical protein [Halocola ammonii]